MFSCLVLAARLSVASDSVTYPCPGTNLLLDLRLDEASIEDVNAIQASALVRSVDLVHAGLSFVSIYRLFKATLSV